MIPQNRGRFGKSVHVQYRTYEFPKIGDDYAHTICIRLSLLFPLGKPGVKPYRCTYMYRLTDTVLQSLQYTGITGAPPLLLRTGIWTTGGSPCGVWTVCLICTSHNLLLPGDIKTHLSR